LSLHLRTWFYPINSSYKKKISYFGSTSNYPFWVWKQFAGRRNDLRTALTSFKQRPATVLDAPKYNSRTQFPDLPVYITTLFLSPAHAFAFFTVTHQWRLLTAYDYYQLFQNPLLSPELPWGICQLLLLILLQPRRSNSELAISLSARASIELPMAV